MPASNETLTGSLPVPLKPKPYSLLDRGGLAVLLMTIAAFLGPAAAWLAYAPPLAAGTASHVEIDMLVWAALLGLLLPVAQIVIHIRRFGGAMIRGNRDNYPMLTGLSARVARAHANHIESLVAFTAVVLAAHAAGVSDRVTMTASVVYLLARITHAVSYLLGITVVRSAAFYGALGATVVIALHIPLL